VSSPTDTDKGLTGYIPTYREEQVDEEVCADAEPGRDGCGESNDRPLANGDQEHVPSGGKRVPKMKRRTEYQCRRWGAFIFLRRLPDEGGIVAGGERRGQGGTSARTARTATNNRLFH
jgi:hypothetical protein